MGPAAPSPSIDPATQALKKQAEEDRLEAIQDRLSQEARDTLIRYGRAKAFAGVGGDLGSNYFSSSFGLHRLSRGL